MRHTSSAAAGATTRAGLGSARKASHDSSRPAVAGERLARFAAAERASCLLLLLLAFAAAAEVIAIIITYCSFNSHTPYLQI